MAGKVHQRLDRDSRIAQGQQGVGREMRARHGIEQENSRTVIGSHLRRRIHLAHLDSFLSQRKAYGFRCPGWEVKQQKLHFLAAALSDWATIES